jgi:hypothetical protein
MKRDIAAIPQTKKDILSIWKDTRGRLAVRMRETNVWCDYDETFTLYFTAEDLFNIKLKKMKEALL